MPNQPHSKPEQLLPRYLIRWGLLIAVAALLYVVGAPDADAAPACQEDAPCWTWSKMGNHKREVVTLSGNVLNVGPCQFRRLWETGHLRYSLTIDGERYPDLLIKLKGDAWARLHGCEQGPPLIPAATPGVEV